MKVVNPKVFASSPSSGSAACCSELAALLQVSLYTVQARCRAQEWPHLKVRGRNRFTPAHVKQIEGMHEVRPKPPAAAQTWGRRTRSGS